MLVHKKKSTSFWWKGDMLFDNEVLGLIKILQGLNWISVSATKNILNVFKAFAFLYHREKTFLNHLILE